MFISIRLLHAIHFFSTMSTIGFCPRLHKHTYTRRLDRNRENWSNLAGGGGGGDSRAEGSTCTHPDVRAGEKNKTKTTVLIIRIIIIIMIQMTCRITI